MPLPPSLFRYVIAIVFFISFFFIGTVTSACNDSLVLNITDDAYHYSPSSINPFEGDYKEWWFFTFSEKSTGLAWCMGYSVTDPPSQKNHYSGIAGMFWPDFNNNASDIQLITNQYPYSAFSATSNNASLSIGSSNRITVLDETTYFVEGATQDGSLQWSLTYHQGVPACREIFEVTLVELDWMSYMPTATVQGYFIINGVKQSVDGIGYHDHNWGVWPTSDFNWVWAQYGDVSQNFAFVMGAYNIIGTNEYIGYTFVRYNGTQIKIGTLCMDSFELKPLKFEKWEEHTYCVAIEVEVKGEEWKLEVSYEAISSGPNPGGRGLNLLVFEQISNFNVTFSRTDGKGGWNELVQSSGIGFNEWSDIIKIF